jgi:hypothetical protein
MHQGSSAVMGTTLVWRRSKISMFEVEAVPHSYNPYIQVGFKYSLFIGRWETESIGT